MLSKIGLNPGDVVVNKKSLFSGVLVSDPKDSKKLNPCHKEYLSVLVFGKTYTGKQRFDRLTEWSLKNVVRHP